MLGKSSVYLWPHLIIAVSWAARIGSHPTSRDAPSVSARHPWCCEVRAMPKPNQPSEQPVAMSEERQLNLSMMSSPPPFAGDDTRLELQAEAENEPLNPTVRERLVQALVKAETRKRRRGPPASAWRQRLAVPMAQVMNQFPNVTLTALAQMLKELDLENIRARRRSWGLPHVWQSRTIYRKFATAGP